MTGTIVVTRAQPRAKWRDMLRRYKITLDGDDVASLRVGESAEVEVPVGTHVIGAEIDWTSAPPVEVDVREHETVRLVVRPSRSIWRALEDVSWNRGRYLTLERE